MRKTTQLTRFVLLVVFLVAMLAACRRATPAAPVLPFPTVPNPNKIEDVPCPFQTDPSGPKVTCGTLAVPEDYRNPQEAQIRLFVAIAHRTGDKPAKEPVIALYQDYDGPFVEYATRYAAYYPLWPDILQEHDLVFYDLRGIGLSEPDTACPDVAPAQFGLLGQKLDRAARLKAYAEIIQACRQKLVQSGIHLENFTTAQNVADLNSVIMAVEAPKVSLLALGYGAYLSLRVMQDNPDRIRGALLSSPYNGQVLASDAAARLHNVLARMFASCKASQDCNAAYPSLEQDFYAAVEKLNRNPAAVTLNATYLNGQAFPVLVTGDTFLDLTVALLSRTAVSSLPSLVYYINLDRSYHLGQPMQDIMGIIGYGNPGVGTSVYCQAYLEAHAKSRPKGQADPALRDWQAYGQQADELVCTGWFSRQPEPSENPGRPSSVPALVVYGEWNPYVPPEWVESNFQSFSNARLVKFPNTGWVDWYGSCVTQLAVSFLEDPAAQPEASCAKATPEVQFTVPIK